MAVDRKRAVDRAGEVVSGPELIKAVWQDVFVEDANLRTQLTALRKALGDGQDRARYIVNVPSQGYTFVANVTQEINRGMIDLEGAVQKTEASIPKLPRLMVGREKVVDKLVGTLALRRFVTLVGTGGIGKTTVAAAVAQSLDRSNPDTNVCFVDLQTVNHPSDVARFVASSVGCADHASRPEQALITYLSDRMICLILDIVNI